MAFRCGQKCEQQYFSRSRMFLHSKSNVFTLEVEYFEFELEYFEAEVEFIKSKSKTQIRSQQEMQNYNRKGTEVMEVGKTNIRQSRGSVKFLTERKRI